MSSTGQSEFALDTDTRSSWWAHDGYAPFTGGRDECLAAAGRFRPAWEGVVAAVNDLGPAALDRRHADARRLLRENGVTYTVYGDPHGRNRTWELDPLPLVLDAADWAEAERGLQQRAELLNLILLDLYGPRRLIREGVLPPTLIYGHPGFLRACDGLRSTGTQALLMHGVDLARGQDGHWWVYADRTQVPSGAGYALENRQVISKVMADEFHAAPVQRLNGFFWQWRRMLQTLTHHRREDPFVVVLTSGPGNETYFEHAFLASFMGHPLVQGGDLLVRDHRVWLKSIDGLQQVDVILRRVDDAWCDPLELREDSMLGVPGLLGAVRAGHVAMANPLGAGVLEARALLPFLPACAKFFLGEELRLASVATWWCGQPAELSHVLAHLDTLVVKQAYSGGTSWFGPRLSRAQRAELAARIRANPSAWVGQEYARFSTTPALVGPGRIEPRHMMLRGFLCADGRGYQVMPGGLTRVARDAEGLFIANQRGGVSKDTWVLADGPLRAGREMRPAVGTGKGAHEGRLPSRTAENLFWVGRYAERAEGIARLMRVAIDKWGDCEDFGDDCDRAVLDRLLRSLTTMTAAFPGFVGEGADARLAAPREELCALASQRERRGSLADTCASLLNAAYGVRDLWFGDTWRTVGMLSEAASRLQKPVHRLLELQSLLDEVIAAMSAFSGVTAESMRHDHAWVLLDLGRRLERSAQQAHLLDQCLVTPLAEASEPLLVEALLACCESLTAQRRRFKYSAEVSGVLDLLVLDDRHPRSLAFQVARMQKRVEVLPRPAAAWGDRFTAAERIVIDLATRLKLTDVAALSALGESPQRNALSALLLHVREQVWALSTAVSSAYFSHAPQARSLAPPSGLRR